jgi:hypothetical protein
MMAGLCDFIYMFVGSLAGLCVRHLRTLWVARWVGVEATAGHCRYIIVPTRWSVVVGFVVGLLVAWFYLLGVLFVGLSVGCGSLAVVVWVNAPVLLL